MLQAGRSPVPVPDEVDFLIYLILPVGNLLVGKERPARRADNFAAICEPNI
jgi:hypothetical protein